jgi:hypothetical protein
MGRFDDQLISSDLSFPSDLPHGNLFLLANHTRAASFQRLFVPSAFIERGKRCLTPQRAAEKQGGGQPKAPADRRQKASQGSDSRADIVTEARRKAG